MLPVYLDYNATTPIDPEVAAAMLPFLVTAFGNPSSTHWFGLQTKKAVEEARRQVADLLGCHTDEILFTSGGSEANNLAIKGFCLAHRDRGSHLIISAVEHPAVVQVAAHLATLGFAVTTLPVDRYGMVSPRDLESALQPETLVVSVMHANNEVGTIEPIAELAAITHARGAVFHCDAAQSIGKIGVRVDELGVDLLSIAGHKLYAPKGIGALYIRRGIHIEKQIHGANHERDLRAGTENVLEIAGLGAACMIARRDLAANSARMTGLRDRLHDDLASRLDGLQRNGHPKQTLPNTLSVSFHNLEANTILAQLEEVAASAGAACHSDAITVSPVLEAMQVPLEWAMGTIRFSVGKMTTEEEIDRAVGGDLQRGGGAARQTLQPHRPRHRPQRSSSPASPTDSAAPANCGRRAWRKSSAGCPGRPTRPCSSAAKPRTMPRSIASTLRPRSSRPSISSPPSSTIPGILAPSPRPML